MNLKINGLLLLDKPLHLSSNQALQKVKRLLGAKKAGHTGTLDPLATGMLPICLGEATKFAQYLLDETKQYRFTAYFGKTTTTADAEGEIIQERDVPVITFEDFQVLLRPFLGEIQQIPPIYSALKVNGKPLYELARKGETVEIKPRTVTIFKLEVVQFDLPFVTFDVTCSKGTYIRSLASDLGEHLGCGAYVYELRRMEIGNFKANQMITLGELEKNLDSLAIFPIDRLVQQFKPVYLNELQTFQICRGQTIKPFSVEEEHCYRLYDHQGRFLGLGVALNEVQLKPLRLINIEN